MSDSADLAFMRSLTSALVSRAQLGGAAGLTFGGQRDVSSALGYKKDLKPEDYRLRYRRNAVAARVIEAFPRGTWRGVGGELVENQDPKTITEFEKAWFALSERLKIWPKLMAVDILAGLGRYAVLLIGAPGNMDSELPATLQPEEVVYLAPYAEEDALIDKLEIDKKNERYGMPLRYKIKRINENPAVKGAVGSDQFVHWSRILHVADGLLDDQVYGLPRLERVWNLLDDLEKVTGAGAESFWLRAHQGYQFNLDKDLRLDAQGEQDLSDEVDEFVNGLRRAVRTRGVDLQVLGSDVATFDRNVDAIISQISSGTSIPQRILMGSERGQLASQQDRVNWAERVQDRRTEFAGPLVVRPLVDRFIKHGVLPTPKEYEVRWPQILDLSDDERAEIANKWAMINQKNGGDKDSTKVVVTPNEIRDHVMGLGPISKADLAEMAKKEKEALKAKAAKPALPFGGKKPIKPAKPIPAA